MKRSNSNILWAGLIILTYLSLLPNVAGFEDYVNETIQPNNFFSEEVGLDFYLNVTDESENKEVNIIIPADSQVKIYLLSELDFGNYLSHQNYTIYANLTQEVLSKIKTDKEYTDMWNGKELHENYNISYKDTKKEDLKTMKFIILIINENLEEAIQFSFTLNFESFTLHIISEAFETLLIFIIAALAIILLLRAHQFKKIDEIYQYRMAHYSGIALLFGFANYIMFQIKFWLNDVGIEPFNFREVGGELFLEGTPESIQILYIFLIAGVFFFSNYPIEKYMKPAIKKINQPDLSDIKPKNKIIAEIKQAPVSYSSIITLIFLPLAWIFPIFDIFVIILLIQLFINIIYWHAFYIKIYFSPNSNTYMKKRILMIIAGFFIIIFFGLARDYISVILTNTISIIGAFLFYYGVISSEGGTNK